MRIPGSRTARRALASALGPAQVSPKRSRPTEHALVLAAKARIADERADRLSVFRDAIAEGRPLEAAAVHTAQRMVDSDERLVDRAFLLGLAAQPSTRTAGQLGMAVFLLGDRLFHSSAKYFEAVGRDAAVRFAPVEYFDARIRTHGRSAIAELDAFLSGARHELTAAERFHALTVLAAHVAVDPLRRELLAFAPADEAELSDDDRYRLRVMRQQTLGDFDVSPEEGAVSIAVMEYKTLDAARSSRNQGDYVQTLAALSHLVRFPDVEFVGETRLAAYLNDLKGCVAADRLLPGVAAKVVPVPFNRDSASERTYPPDTWLISNGWFMHRSFGGDPDFPYPDTVNPIFVSFHVQQVDVLTDEVVANLKKHAPIGCRDWTSVYRLRDHGIPCFFSGCVTTTVGQVLEPAAPAGRRRAAWVEPKNVDASEYRGWDKAHRTQVDERLVEMDIVDCIENARAMLNGYASFDAVVTSRLHCYLPARSMGLTVDFRPRNRADIRFDGLLDLDEARFDAIRDRMNDKLETVYRMILSGADRDEVYARWRDINAADVAEAERHATSDLMEVGTSVDIPAAAAQMRASAWVRGADADDAIDVAFSTDENLRDELAVVIESVRASVSRPLRIHVLTRGLSEAYVDHLAALFPDVRLQGYPCDDVDYGAEVNLLSHTTVSTLDRLMLPELLPDLAKVLYLDIDTYVSGDVAELFDIELGDNVIAGKPSRMLSWSSMVKPVSRSSLAFSADQAARVRRTLHARGDLTARTVNAGVLLFNLEAMRAEGFSDFAMGLAEKLRLNDQDALNIYARGRVHIIPDRWNHVPAQDFNDDRPPDLVHWAGPSKPWGDLMVPYGDLFTDTRARIAARADVLGVPT